jgi:hypothetical protein
MLPAVSFFEGFQTPAGSRETRARSSGRHLKPITEAEIALGIVVVRTAPKSGNRSQ